MTGMLARKLLRDLVRMRTQVAAIAAIVACGIAILVSMTSNDETLRTSRDRYYARYALADVFVSLTRAPESVAQRIAAIPGVTAVETRVVASVTLDLPGRADPVGGLFVSLPDGREPRVNRIFVRAGRSVRADASDEVVVSEGFATANGLRPGAALGAILNGRRQILRVVGIGLSPEYVYEIGPGAIWPDSRRFGVLWMGRRALAAAYDMTGAFDDAALRLAPGVAPGPVVAAVDRIAARYGGRGAFPRADQPATWFLANELVQLRTQGLVIPLIFLAVATVLANALLARLVATERVQIGTLKAFGYSGGAIARHYLGFALAVILAGGAAGIAAGALLGRALAGVYQEFYRFPFLTYRLSPLVVTGAVLVCALAAILGALRAVRAAAALPPAEAMQPAAPPRYRRTLVERLGLAGWTTPTERMVLRNLERRPATAAVGVLGIALATSLLVVGLGSLDSAQHMIDVQFRTIQREDATIGFAQPRARRALFDVRHLPGVLRVEPFRTVAVRFRHGSRTYRAAITGTTRDATLRRPLDARERPVALPARGLLLSATLGRILGARAGDRLEVETLEGRRVRFDVPVGALLDEPIGLSALMEIDELDRRIGEPATLGGAHLAVDPAARARFDAALKAMPQLAAVGYRGAELATAEETIRRGFDLSIGIVIAFAVTMAFGVAYNGGRITLAERARELATLRIVGFTRREIAAITSGEQAILTALGIPLGLAGGAWLFALIALTYRTELYRVPVVITPASNALAALVVGLAALASVLAVGFRLRRLDLVAVLKGE